jgi:hypothetical protein
MAFVFGDRVKETSTSVGLGSFVLDGAVAGFQSFTAGIGNTNQCYYTIESTTDFTWEVGIGTVSGAAISRDSVLSSSNSGLPVNFAAGTKQVFATETADHFNSTLDIAGHAAVNHTGLPGVPAAEAFTSVAHAVTNHSGLPGIPPAEVFTAAAHNLVDHTASPHDLLDEVVHALVDHTGIPGVGGSETYDQTAHDADDHSAVSTIQPPSQAEAEAGVAATARLWTALRVAQAIAAQTGLQVTTQFFTAVNTITIPTGYQPKLALFVGKYVGLTNSPTIGYAVNTGPSNQGVVIAGTLDGVAGFIAADNGGAGAIDETHTVTTFNTTQVQATQTLGTTAWTGFVIVLGG